jgi:hypothetical protein
MITDRFVRNIWAVNGVIFLGFFVVSFGFAAVIFIADRFDNTDYTDELIVGEDIEEAKKKGLILQGISYGSLVKLRGSEFYILPISAKTYEEPKPKTLLGNSYEDAATIRIDGRTAINVLFLDSKFNVINTLTDKQIFISELNYPIFQEYDTYTDSAQHHITYQIAIADSDNDGTINFSDNDDLYISELDGSNLRQVTKNVDVIEYSFPNRNQILIAYKTRTDERDEYKRVFYAIYSIKENKLEELKSIEKALDNVRTILRK